MKPLRMKINNISFVGIPVTDIPRARKFYEKVLGLPVSDEMMSGKWIEYAVGNNTLAIANVGDQWTPSDQGTGTALEVEDFEEAIKHLKDQHVRFAAEPFETPCCHMAVVQDPDGNKLIIHKLKPENEKGICTWLQMRWPLLPSLSAMPSGPGNFIRKRSSLRQAQPQWAAHGLNTTLVRQRLALVVIQPGNRRAMERPSRSRWRISTRQLPNSKSAASPSISRRPRHRSVGWRNFAIQTGTNSSCTNESKNDKAPAFTSLRRGGRMNAEGMIK